MRLDTLRATYESRIAAKDEEISRLRTENSDQRRELSKARDLPGQIKAFKATAGELGLEEPSNEPEAPETWQQMALQVIQRLPEIIKSAGDTVGNLRQPVLAAPLPPPAQPGLPMLAAAPTASGAPPPGYRGPNGALPFATEDGPPYYGPNDVPAGPPVYPPARAEHMPEPPPAPAPPAAPPPRPPAEAAPAAPPPPAASPPAAPARATDPRPGELSMDDQLRVRQFMEAAIEQGVAPKAFADQVVAQVGTAQAQALMAALNPETITEMVMRSPSGIQSPLVRREGQKWLRATWVALEKAAAYRAA
jgi:hypothetical protein